jgi:predicted component of type VI protein secretion system
MVSLRLVPVSGNPIDVTRDPSLVGRDPSCEVVVTDGSVSRRHARLERRGGEWWVVDQGSANGTYVNSLKIAETALKNSQELRFGALAFRVDIEEDPEATVASPVLPEETVMATATPEPTPPPAPPPPTPAAPPPPPPPRGATAAGDRFRPAGSAPVPQMSGGAPPAKKGRGPVFWIAVGCCGCLLLVLVLGGLLGGGAFLMTKGVADAGHAWLADVREGRTDQALGQLTDECRSRLTDAELEEIVSAIQGSDDATFPSRQVENDRAVLTGVLTGSGAPRPVVLHLVKQDGGWMIDDVVFEEGLGTFGE